jgi:hypothetical protein
MRALINEINPDESVPNMRSEQPTCQLHALAKRAQRSFSNYAKQSSTGTALLQKKRNGKYRLLSASRASGRVDGRFGSCLRERTRGGSIWLRARVKPPNCSDRQRRERVRVHLVIAARECRSNGTVPSFLYPSGTCAPIEEVVEVHGPTHLCPSSTRPSHKLGTRSGHDGVGGLHPHGG